MGDYNCSIHLYMEQCEEEEIFSFCFTSDLVSCYCSLDLRAFLKKSDICLCVCFS